MKVTAAQQAFFIGSVINRILYTGVILAVVLVGGPDASVVRSLVRGDGKVLEGLTPVAASDLPVTFTDQVLHMLFATPRWLMETPDVPPSLQLPVG